MHAFNTSKTNTVPLTHIIKHIITNKTATNTVPQTYTQAGTMSHTCFTKLLRHTHNIPPTQGLTLGLTQASLNTYLCK